MRIRRRHAYNARPHSSCIQRGGGTGPLKPRQPFRACAARKRCQFQQAPCQSLGDVGGFSSQTKPLPQPGRGFLVVRRQRCPLQALSCKECHATYPLDASYVCEQCFGPLEVAYDHSALGDPAELRRKIQAGPASIWRYADFLPFARRPRPLSTPGFTPLIRSERLAERLGVGEVYVKNDAANPTHSFKDRVVNVAVAKAKELGYEVVACASTATSRTPSPPTPPPRGSTPTCSSRPTSRSRRSSRPASTAPGWSP